MALVAQMILRPQPDRQGKAGSYTRRQLWDGRHSFTPFTIVSLNPSSRLVTTNSNLQSDFGYPLQPQPADGLCGVACNKSVASLSILSWAPLRTSLPTSIA